MKYVKCGDCILYETDQCPVKSIYSAVLTPENGCTSGKEKQVEECTTKNS